MRRSISRTLRSCAFLALAAGTHGCVAGFGPTPDIRLTAHGAAGVVHGVVAQVDRRTRAVLADVAVRVDQRTREGESVGYSGSREGVVIQVELRPAGAETTQVRVTARRGVSEWDREYARAVLERIATRADPARQKR